MLTDSKQLNARQREQLREEVVKNAIHWAVAQVSPQEIDEINILNASFLAMHRALDQLPIAPEYLLVDGNRFTPYKEVPHACMVKGDSRFFSIAAASILAKTHRDDLMRTLAAEHPHYGWEQNAGYPTKTHRTAIAQYGTCAHHRLTFRLLPETMEAALEEGL